MANELTPITDEERLGWWQATRSVTTPGAPVEPPPPEVVEDFNDARENLAELSKIALQAVADAAAVASQTSGDKHYAALASLIRAANETQRDRMDVHKRKKELIAQQKTNHFAGGDLSNPTTVNNTQVIMTTADMLKLIRGESK